MNYPCTDYSDYMVNACLGYEESYKTGYDNNLASQACGQSVEDYISNVKLTTDQLEESKKLMSIMKDKSE